MIDPEPCCLLVKIQAAGEREQEIGNRLEMGVFRRAMTKDHEPFHPSLWKEISGIAFHWRQVNAGIGELKGRL